ncbi:hypothetical protein [Hoeflea sp. TYP-13]|uniref:hypothetical protein n=1 Tax=Hoeflea sp. TYP-13 TaxID=3230023 RepID=UPI0034C6DCA9
MSNRAASKSVPDTCEKDGIQVPTHLTNHASGDSNFNKTENKTRTDINSEPIPEPLPPQTLAKDLGIEPVWRVVIDFGEPTSGTGEEGWGRKSISVSRVTILDGPREVEGEPRTVRRDSG